MGFGPQLVDLNGDGHVDLLSGSWPGEIFLFRGGPGRSFAAPEMLKDRDGNFINIGGGMAETPSGILITGNGEFEETPDGSFVNYHGKRLKSTPEKPISVTGTASAVHATDWDADGDVDLLVGDIHGAVYLVPNEGTRQSYAFAKERRIQVGGKPLEVKGDAGPMAADWDADGDLDLLVGSGDGSVTLFRNEGTSRTVKLSGGKELVPDGEITYGGSAPKEPRRGIRSKVWACDWNGDRRLDLLVGDFATQKPDRPPPTAEELAEHERIRKEMKPLEERHGELMAKVYGRSPPLGKEREVLQKEMDAIFEKVQALGSKIPPEYESHGWVWLFLRAPGTSRE